MQTCCRSWRVCSPKRQPNCRSGRQLQLSSGQEKQKAAETRRYMLQIIREIIEGASVARLNEALKGAPVVTVLSHFSRNGRVTDRCCVARGGFSR